MIVAQLSDIHAAPGNDNISRLDRAMSWLAILGPDALVVSGDLIDDGWIDGYADIAARLAGLRCPTLLVPGNSDDRGAMRAAFATRPGAIADCDAMHFALDVSGLRLIGIDSCLDGTSAGDVTPHLAWLGQVLDAPGGMPRLFSRTTILLPAAFRRWTRLCRVVGRSSANCCRDVLVRRLQYHPATCTGP